MRRSRMSSSANAPGFPASRSPGDGGSALPNDQGCDRDSGGAASRGLSGARCAARLLRSGALGQNPVGTEKVASIAVRIVLEIILMLRLGFPERASRRHFRRHLARPQARGVDIGDGVESQALLFVARGEDRRTIACADVVALPAARRWILNVKEEVQPLAAADRRRVESD